MRNAVELLKREEFCNSLMLDMLRRDPNRRNILAPRDLPTALALAGDTETEWHLAAYGLRGLKELIGQLPPSDIVCFTHQAWIYDIIQSRYQLAKRTCFLKMSATSEDFKDNTTHGVERLTREHEGILRASHFASAAERILEAQAAFGVIRDGALIAKVDIQERTDSFWEINELVVAEEHRNQGIGSSLGAAATKYILDSGRQPIYTAFAQNSYTVLLAEGLGFWSVCAIIRREMSPRGGGGA